MSLASAVDHFGRDLKFAVRGFARSPIALGLALVATVASYVPARRATTVDPAEVLNAE